MEFGYAIKVTSEFGMVEHFQIYGVNPKIESRARTSIVLARKVGSQSIYYIIVRGELNAMKSVLEMGDAEQTLFRNLMVQYREQNLTRFIYAQKKISKEEVTAYVNRYSGIVKAKKYDADSIDRVASLLENRLKFIGSIGVKAKLREEAKPLVDRFIEAGIKVSILSGDNYENTINVARELGLSPLNPTDTSSYFNMAFDSPARARSDFTLYLEQVYHSLKSQNYTTLNKALEARDKPEKDIIQGQRSDGLLRNMVVGGRQLEIVCGSQTLMSHFRVLLAFTGNVLGHDLLPHQKAQFAKLLRMKGESVMAVGDGLNDLGMLNEANISVQLSNGDVPLYFGDLVVNRLDIISRLVFGTGFNLTKNFKGVLLFQSIMWAKLVLVNIWYFNLVDLSAGFYSHYHIVFLVAFFAVEGLFRASFTSKYPASLLAKFPQIYQEKSIFIGKLLLIFYICLVSIGFEIFFVFLLGNVAVGIENFGSGIPFEQEIFYLYFLAMVWFNSTTANYFLSSASTRYNLLVYLLSSVLFGAIMVYHLFYRLPEDFQGFGIFKVFANITFTTCYITAWLVPSYLNSILMTVLKAKVLDPVKYLLKYHRDAMIKAGWNSKEKDLGEDINRFIGIEREKMTPDMIVDQVADVVQPSKSKPIEAIVQKLLLLNIHEFSVGFDQFTNEILDQREHNKFCEANAEKHYRFTVWFIVTLGIMHLIEIGIVLIYVGFDNWRSIEILYKLYPLYMIGLFAVMLIILGYRRRGVTVYRTVNVFMCLALAVEIALFVVDAVMPGDSPMSYHELSIAARMVSSAVPLNFPQACGLIVAFEGLRISRVLFLASPVGQAITNPLFTAILVIDFIALAAAKVSMKKKVAVVHPVRQDHQGQLPLRQPDEGRDRQEQRKALHAAALVRLGQDQHSRVLQ